MMSDIPRGKIRMQAIRPMEMIHHAHLDTESKQVNFNHHIIV